MRNNIDKMFNDKLSAYSSHVSNDMWSNIQFGMVQQKPRSTRRWVLLLLLFILFSIGSFLVFKILPQGKTVPEILPPKPELNTELAFVTDNSVIENKMHSTDQTTLTNTMLTSLQKKSDQNSFSGSGHIITPGGIGIALAPEELSDNKADANKSSLPVNSEIELLSLNKIEKGEELFNNDQRLLLDLPAELGDRRNLLFSSALVSGGYPSKTLGDCFDGLPAMYYLSLNFSADYPIRSLYSGNLGEIQNYIVNRNESETELLSFNAGLKAGYIHPRGWKAETGIQFTQINEKFFYIKENVIKIQTQITIDTLYNNDGSYTINRDTTSIEVLGYEEMKTINQFKMVDIPLIFGYNFYHENLSIELNAGFIFNVSSSASGRIFNQDLVPKYYGKTTNGSFSPYRIRFGTSLYGSVTLKTKILGHSQLYFEPNARYYLRSFASSSNPINQKYLVLGFSTGFRYYF